MAENQKNNQTMNVIKSYVTSRFEIAIDVKGKIVWLVFILTKFSVWGRVGREQ